MKKYLLLTTAISLLFGGDAIASDMQYNIRVDGITCPVCVAASAKSLKKIKGVKEVGSDIEKGIIKVCTDKETVLTDEQLTELFIEKGFTYRSMEKQEQCDKL